MASWKPVDILTATAATAQQTSANFSSEGFESAYFLVNITANPGGAETLTFALQLKLPGADTYRTITAFAASTAATNALFVFVIDRGAVVTSATAGLFGQAIPLPPEWRVVVLHSSTGAWTYTVKAWLFNQGFK
jgi:hypothetical protein